MGKVQQAAGGGKVTVEGLAAAVVQAGKTVTVKQGSKVVQQTKGSYITPLHFGSLAVSGTGSGQTSQATLYMDCAGYSRLSFTVSSGNVNHVTYTIGNVSHTVYANASVQADLNGAATCSLYIKAYSGSINNITLE